jgi:hypothetical protein
MKIKVQAIKQWSKDNCPPFSWERVLFRLLPDFKQEGLFLHLVKDETVLSDNLSQKVKTQFTELYNATIPNELCLSN